MLSELKSGRFLDNNRVGGTDVPFNLATVAMEISFLLTADDHLVFEM